MSPHFSSVDSVAVLGAAFDPPHLGHADVVAQLAERFTHIWLVPSASHPFGKTMTAFEHRWAMLRAWQETLPGALRTGLLLSDIERVMLQAKPEKPVYSYEVLQQVRAQVHGMVYLVLGPDNAKPEVWSRFYRYQDIEREFGVCVVTQRLPVRSTTVRDAVRAGATETEIAALTGEAVARYIWAHTLYTNTAKT
jgi:nicotinate-nucleotide adenylyltransferase